MEPLSELIRLGLVQYVAQGVVRGYAPNTVNRGKVAVFSLAALTEGEQRRTLQRVNSEAAFQGIAHAIARIFGAAVLHEVKQTGNHSVIKAVKAAQ